MPPTFISEVVDGVPNATSTLLPAARFSEPADSWLPDDNARCPPLLMLTEPSAEPVPVRVPPLLTLTCALASEPLRPTVPPLIAVLPVMPLIPVRFKVPVPTLTRPPLPLRSPSKLLVMLALPRVKVLLAVSCTLPLPVSAPRLALLPRFSPAPALMLTL